MNFIQTSKGYVNVTEVESFVVRDSPGWRDNGHVILKMKSGREVDTGMYEQEWLTALAASPEQEGR